MRQIKTVSESSVYPKDFTKIPHSTVEGDDDVIDIRSLLLTVWRGRWIVVICAIITLGLAALYISRLEPTYRASAKVMFGIQQANVVDVQDLLISSEFNQDTLQNEIEVLRSTSLVQRVVEDLGLEHDPEFNPVLAAQRAPETVIEQFFGTFALPPDVQDFLMNVGVVTAPGPPPDEETARFRQLMSVIAAIQGRLSLEPVRGSRVIEVAFVADDPGTAAHVVNTVADQYIVDQLEAKLDTTRSATEWLTTRVEELRQTVQEFEEAVETMRAELTDAAGQSLDITQQQLGALNASLAVVRSQSTALEAQYSRLSIAIELGRDLGSVQDFRESILIREYRAEESDILDRLGTLSENHPERPVLNAQLGRLRDRMKEEAELILASIKVQLDSSQAQEDVLMQDIRELELKSQEQSRDEIQLRQLEREAQASRLLYENFLARLEETSQQESLQDADARVLSPAQPPLGPEFQRKKQILVMASFGGIAVGLGIIFLLDRLNNTFRTPFHIEEVTGEAVLATIPMIGSRIRRQDVIANFLEKPGSSLAESIRNLRTSILFSNVDHPPKVVMFTSSVPREGKSTTSMLMALTSRQMGKSAIIVDCDLRLPSVVRILNAKDNKPGLLSVLEGTADFREAVYEEPSSGLHVLMVRSEERKAQINAADVLSSHRFEELIKELSEQYDLVVLDTPPALIVTDARILSSSVDAVVYAVRWDDTPRDAVMEGLKELKSVSAPIAGIVMTLVNESKASKYAYDGYNYYKGKYKSYYVE